MLIRWLLENKYKLNLMLNYKNKENKESLT